MTRSRIAIALSLLLLIVVATGAEACPNCKEAIAGDPAQQGLSQGFYYSILFMLSTPFFILGGLCSYFYYLVRCERARVAAGGTPFNAASQAHSPA